MLLLLTGSLETDEERLKIAQIYEMYKPLMLNYARKILKSNEYAEDAVHDTFIALIKHKGKYLSQTCADLRIPIVIITKSKCLDILKKTSKQHECIEDYEYTLTSKDIPLDEKLILAEEYQTLRKHLASLDAVSRNILEMRYILSMTHKEISEIHGISLSHVNTKIVRAKAKIRKLAKKDGDKNGK